ncbi:hypothetical protein PSTT_05526 [Puccinia striiformis]|uniref:Uncharacterized protein n=1 Tax=Puccinia striiformis TaxID=27350 RepID=A0A2S4VNJ1_9BASI|nr:hypothetical protein PSTT_05526 [Puccinia striiformis]
MPAFSTHNPFERDTYPGYLSRDMSSMDKRCFDARCQLLPIAQNYYLCSVGNIKHTSCRPSQSIGCEKND